VKIPKISFFVLLRTLMFSFIVFEFVEVLKAIDITLLYKCSSSSTKFIIILYLLLFLYSIIALKVINKIWIILKSFRVDLIFTIIIGAILAYKIDVFFYLKTISFFSNRTIISYKDLLNEIMVWMKEYQLANLKYVLLIPPAAIIYSIIQYYTINKLNRKKHNASGIIDDREILSEKDDKLKISEEANNYAEKIWNNGANNSIVFGLDAPWGTGKSSFLNIVIQYLNKNYSKKVIVCKFNPSQYQNKQNIVDVFAKNLINEIKKKVYLPELFSIVLAYSKVLSNSISSFSHFGINFSFFQKKNNLDELFLKLETLINSTNKKIIIIIDDLDRLDFNTIKEVILVIQKGFSLPNMSFILCYDTANINALDENNHETEKISEFLEKYINIKTSIFIDATVLSNYFVDTYKSLLCENDLANTNFISKIVKGIEGIYNSQEYYKYKPFLSNVRKIKRLVNTIFMLDLHSVDFENWDINIHDFINLLLIYLNYPSIFRTIYDSETAGKKGLFAIKTSYNRENKKTTYKNCTEYSKYIKTLTEHEKFLVNKIFNSERVKNIDSDKFSLACFNGSKFSDEHRNLEKYINLIIHHKKPFKTDENNFYKKIRDEIISNKKPIDKIIWHDEFHENNGTNTHENLYQILYNTPSNDFNLINSKEIINFLKNNISNYPLIGDDGLFGSRYATIYYFINFLDKFGWYDESEQFLNNSNDNVVKLAQMIFESSDTESSILESFIKNNSNSITAIYDLLVFRLSCCSSRGGEHYNLSNALMTYSNPGSRRNGLVSELIVKEVRFLTQRILALFHKEIIVKEVNIFDLIQQITDEVFMGKFSAYFKDKYTKEELDVKISDGRTKILSFILHQLSNDINNMGVGCGYYNLEGIESDSNKGQIKNEMNKYIFEFCFNQEKFSNAYEFLLTYLARFINDTGFSTDKNTIHKESYQHKLSNEVKLELLKTYWAANIDQIEEYTHALDLSKYNFNINELIAVVSEIVNETGLQDK